MGLTVDSMGLKAVDNGLTVKKLHDSDKIIALAGNPNVGKSTVFNGLTGLNQHTGNWPGKTVTNAQGLCIKNGINYIMVDIPGTYSLMAHSPEEEVARDFICFGNPDAIVVVCDATCLERNLNLVLQTIEIAENVVVCVNLMDEAKKKCINIDLLSLQKRLGVPVVGTIARSKKNLDEFMSTVELFLTSTNEMNIIKIDYPEYIENVIAKLQPSIENIIENKKISSRWIALKLLDLNEPLINSLIKYLGYNLLLETEILDKLSEFRETLLESNINEKQLRDDIVSSIILTAENVCRDTVSYTNVNYNDRDRKIDRILTNRISGLTIMIALLGIIFWLTITGSNIPSSLIAKGLFWIEDKLIDLALWLGVPTVIYQMLILGVYRVIAWIISVMLPPMAIFFPLFTLLEDLGYLPRVAFNLDKTFKKCSACGKQALTMCMGFGCNAAGVIGCRIIDSPRERLIAIITNTFVPCNGRFPTLISIIAMFFTASIIAPFGTIVSSILLTVVVLFGIVVTFLISKLLSVTILKGQPSSFSLELPPYRKPQIGKIIIRSIFDRTLFVLSRAIIVAAPAGLIIWLFANLTVGEVSPLSLVSTFLDPFAKLLGMDGVILFAFILGFPANEIIVPIIIMSYMAGGSLMEFESLADLKTLLISNGWTWVTAVSTMLFMLMHWPCSTTCLTIKKETGSLKWTALSFAIPTIIGALVCFMFASITKLFI